MNISVIAIGDELLIGQVTDTNSGDIARTIAPAGWTLCGVQVVHDDAGAIRNAILKAFETADIVLTTGGLGPTKDDITKATLTDIFGGTLIFDPGVMANVRRVFERRGLNMNRLTETQAMVPSSCRVIQNDLGTAPVMWFEHKDGKVLVAMPGVPFETRHAFSTRVFPMLLERFGQGATLAHRHFIVYGTTESALAEMLSKLEENLPGNLHLAYLPNQGYIRLRLDAIGTDENATSNLINHTAKEIKRILGSLVIAENDLTPEQILIEKLRKHGLTFGSAESCTGGNIAHRITMIPGASEVMQGAVVSYSNDVKTGVLGVSADTLAQHGAVSEPVARQMAEGALKALGCQCAVATSGIAGPGGGSAEKPVGTVCMAFATPDGTTTRTFHFPGDRSRVIERASTVAMIELALHLS